MISVGEKTLYIAFSIDNLGGIQNGTTNLHNSRSSFEVNGKTYNYLSFSCN